MKTSILLSIGVLLTLSISQSPEINAQSLRRRRAPQDDEDLDADEVDIYSKTDTTQQELEVKSKSQQMNDRFKNKLSTGSETSNHASKVVEYGDKIRTLTRNLPMQSLVEGY